MKQLIITLASLACWMLTGCVEDVTTRETEQFVKIYGGSGDEQGNDVIQLNDGTTLMLGSTTTTSTGELSNTSSIYLLWADEKGDVFREVTIPSERNETGIALLEIADDYLVVAESREQFANKNDIRVIRISATGEVMNSNIIGFTSFDEQVGGVTALPDGGYLIVGTTENADSKEGVDPIEDVSDILLVRLSATDEIVWSEKFGFGGADEGNAVTLDNSGNIILAGTTSFQQGGRQGNNLVLYRINDSGLETAVRIYGGDRDESVSRIYSRQGQFYIIGSIGTQTQSESAIWQFSQTLDSLRALTFSVVRNETGADMAFRNDGSYAVVSNGRFAGNGLDFSYVIVDPNGNVVPVSTFGANGNDLATRIFMGNDGKVSLYGTVFFENRSKITWIKPGYISEATN
ncbi:MAG: hypothetical protein WBB45_05675 [Cyclobacteriaceae bacterium]